MVFVCFPGKALSKDLINLPTLAFVNMALESGAVILVPEVLAVCQPEKVSFSSGRSEIPRLQRLSQRHSNGRRANQGRT